ncbi:MAG: cytochrome b5-like heme/steroid binding domain-containing protein [Micropruina sp.]|uniref:cytochrome b5 domain-containing protein n=1 Tax=Micropruina sp. TaxID=2737536 RepID=UPI0039E71081
MYDVFGLPLHPLVVHAVVVLLPLSALGLIACVLFGRLRTRYAGLTLLGLIAGTAASFVAVASGRALADQVGTPAAHMALGVWLPWVATATLVLGAAWYLLQRGKESPPPLARVLGWVSAVAAAGSIGLTVAVGHSGATAVWSGTTAVTAPTTSAVTPSASASSSASASRSPSASGTASAKQSYTLDEVKKHNSAGDCWAAINGGVYDLTGWVSQHPGGSERIIALCGTDASAAFNTQHGGQTRPESTLTQFYLGELAG